MQTISSHQSGVTLRTVQMSEFISNQERTKEEKIPISRDVLILRILIQKGNENSIRRNWRDEEISAKDEEKEGNFEKFSFFGN